MQVDVSWQGEVYFLAKNQSGHRVPMDGPPESGGQDRGSRPLELMLMGLGGCTAFDVVDILRKGRQSIDGVDVSINARRAGSIPAMFEEVDVHFVVVGSFVEPAKVERAIALTAKKYCSASIMLERAGVVIRHTFEIVQSDKDA